jgi:two-component system cell cycle response regulator
MPSLTPDLQPLLAVAAASLDRNGIVTEANAGFMRLINAPERPPGGTHAARFFLQPDFATLIRADVDGEIYHGLLTMGDYVGHTSTLRARVYRVNAGLRVIAEYDIAALERLNDKVLELNRDYADAQLQLAQTNLKLQQREAQILALSLTDPLTGVGNRRRMEQALAEQIGRSQRIGEKLCAFIADLDHFKRVNDTYGHEAGDKVLAAFGELLRRKMRTSDVVTRFGGEEFVALMPDTDLEHGLASAERIREALACRRVEPLPEPVTASFGVAELAAGETGDALLRRLDKALYAAKAAGRNCVIAE